MSPAPGNYFSTYTRLFRKRNFTALWSGQLVSFIGDYFNWLAIPITINRLTGSISMVGLSFIINAIPALLLGPVAGVLVDRLDRRKVMIVSDLLRALLVLALLTIQSAQQIWVFYLIGFLISCASQFFFPARNALLPLVVEDEKYLMQANTLMQFVFILGLLAGPAMAGFAIGLYGERVAFVVNSLGYLVSATSILLIRMPARPSLLNRQPVTFGQSWMDLRQGFAYIIHNRTLVGVLTCMFLTMLGAGGLNAVWIPYLQRAFQVGAEGIGMVDSAQGAGMVISGLLIGPLVARFRYKNLTAGSILWAGFFLAGIGMAPNFPLLLLSSFGIGLGLLPLQAGLNTIQQLASPDAMRGRVGAAFNMVTTFSSLTSLGLAATLGEIIGLSQVLITCGSVVLISGVLGFWLIKEPRPAPQEGSVPSAG
jgi:MFS transporter, DHA3 family, macrolide efflux protein